MHNSALHWCSKETLTVFMNLAERERSHITLPKTFLLTFLSCFCQNIQKFPFSFIAHNSPPSDTTFPAHTQVFKGLLSTPTGSQDVFSNKTVLSLEGFLEAALAIIKMSLLDFMFIRHRVGDFKKFPLAIRMLLEQFDRNPIQSVLNNNDSYYLTKL